MRLVFVIPAPTVKLRLFCRLRDFKILLLFFQKRNDTLGQRIRDEGYIVFYKNYSELTEKICGHEKYALIYNTLFPIPDLSCTLLRIPIALTPVFPVFILGHQNFYTDIINHV